VLQNRQLKHSYFRQYKLEITSITSKATQNRGSIVVETFLYLFCNINIAFILECFFIFQKIYIYVESFHANHVKYYLQPTAVMPVTRSSAIAEGPRDAAMLARSWEL